MRWRRGGDSPDVIDARGSRGRRGGLPVAGGGVGLVGLLVILAFQFLGGGGGGFQIPGAAFDPGAGGAGPASDPIPAAQDPERDLRDFSAYVFTDAQELWRTTFERDGKPYQRAKLVLFRSGVNTACGSASSAVGPFYCPGDQRVYLDLSFYRDLSDRLSARGDFAWAYVIAHEVGHHVQRQLGTEEQVRREQRSDPDSANELSVRLELQADCYAGVWGHRVFREGDLEQGDLDEAIAAAGRALQPIVADRLGGGVNPDSFTHGTSEQRQTWFRAGYGGGDPAACDTFAPDSV